MTPYTLHLLIFMGTASITLFAARAAGAYINRRFLTRPERPAYTRQTAVSPHHVKKSKENNGIS